MDSHKGDRIPQQKLHSELVHLRDKLLHIRYSLAGYLPIAAVGITTFRIRCMPTIIDNDRFTAQALGQSALLQDLFRNKLLMEAIPGGIHRKSGFLWHGRRSISGLGRPPLADFLQAFRIEPFACVDAKHHLVMSDR
ncbi:hypothetical protein D3C81_1442290 [compost metagenome]